MSHIDVHAPARLTPPHHGVAARSAVQAIAPSTASPALLPPHPRGGIVGRRVERHHLSVTLDRLGAGVGGFLEISGDPGIGKTTLLTELRRESTARGLTTLHGRAAGGSRAAPLQLIVETLDDSLRGWPLDGAARWGAGTWDETNSSVRMRFLVILRRLLAGLAVDGLVLILDDLHAADAGTIAVVAHLLRHPVPAPLLVAVAHRPRQSPPDLGSALAAGAEDGSLERLRVEPLDAEAAASLLGCDPADPSIEPLYRASGGNPRYLLLLRRACPDNAQTPMPDAALEPLILSDVDGLTPAESLVADAAAVFAAASATPVPYAARPDRPPTGISVDHIAAVTELDPDVVTAAVNTLTRRDLLRPAGSGPLLTFRHPLVAWAFYARTDLAWRVEAHRRALTRLSSTGAAPTQRAAHLVAAALPIRAEEYAVFVEAAESVQDCPAEAARWLRIAREHLPMAAEYDQARMVLARALVRAGRPVEGRELLQSLPVSPALRPCAVMLWARIERMLCCYPEAKALLRRELRGRPSLESVESVSLLVELAAVGVFSDSYADVRDDAQRAVAAARQLGGEGLLASALATRALGEAWHGDPHLAARLIGQASVLVDGMPDGDLAERAETLGRLGWAELSLERFLDAERHLRRGAAIARRAGDRHPLAFLCLGLSRVTLLRVHVPTAIDYAAEAEALARETGSTDLACAASWARADAMVWSGDDARAVNAHGRGEPLPATGCAHRHLAAGQGADLEGRALAALAAGDLAAAAQWAQRCTAEAARRDLAGQRGYAHRARGAVLVALGDRTGAMAAFEAAVEAFATTGMRLEEGRSRLDLALALLFGRQRGAAAMLDLAAELATAAEAGALLARVETVRAMLRRVAPAANPDQLALLTDREREVAVLVGTGESNREIAQRLHLSTRTVESHLGRIYRKLEVRSRTALARLIERAHTAALPGSWLPGGYLGA